MILETIGSVSSIKEQIYQKSRSKQYHNSSLVNRSDTHINTGFYQLDQYEAENDCYDSFDENNRYIDDEEYEDFPEANIIIKFNLLPNDVGIMFGEHISSDQILQESERNISIKEFDPDFLEIFKNSMEDRKSDNDIDIENSVCQVTESGFNANMDFGNIVAKMQKRQPVLNSLPNKLQPIGGEKKTILNLTDNVGDKVIQDKVEELVPTIVSLKDDKLNEHRNHVIGISEQKRSLIKNKLVDLSMFFIKEKLNLLRFVRPMNSEIIQEVLKCMSQIK